MFVKKNKKILFLIPSISEIGGSEKSFRSYISMIEKDYEIHIFVFSGTFKWYTPSNVTFHTFKALRTSNLILWCKIIKLSYKIRPDAICAWSIISAIPLLFVKSVLYKTDIWVSLRDSINSYTLYNYNFLTKLLLHILVKYRLKKTNLIYSNSLENINDTIKYSGTNPQYIYMPNSVDFETIEKLSEVEFNDNLYKSEKSYKLLFVGRLTYQKGVDILLKAVSKLTFEWELIIYGSGDELDNLKYLSDKLKISDKITWLSGTNPYPFYKFCDIVVSASRHEGFPNVFIEALSLGKSFISSNCKTGINEISKNQTLGLVFQVDDVNDLINKLIFAYENPEIIRKMGVDGKIFVYDNFRYDYVKNYNLSQLNEYFKKNFKE